MIYKLIIIIKSILNNTTINKFKNSNIMYGNVDWNLNIFDFVKGE